jgi:hypothetical protein
MSPEVDFDPVHMCWRYRPASRGNIERKKDISMPSVDQSSHRDEAFGLYNSLASQELQRRSVEFAPGLGGPWVRWKNAVVSHGIVVLAPLSAARRLVLLRN